MINRIYKIKAGYAFHIDKINRINKNRTIKNPVNPV